MQCYFFRCSSCSSSFLCGAAQSTFTIMSHGRQPWSLWTKQWHSDQKQKFVLYFSSFASYEISTNDILIIALPAQHYLKFIFAEFWALWFLHIFCHRRTHSLSWARWRCKQGLTACSWVPHFLPRSSKEYTEQKITGKIPVKSWCKKKLLPNNPKASEIVSTKKAAGTLKTQFPYILIRNMTPLLSQLTLWKSAEMFKGTLIGLFFSLENKNYH